MESLRSRSAQAANADSTRRTKLSKGSRNVTPIPRPTKSKVDDKIKKRMSMRYAISPPNLDSLTPAVPALPAAAAAFARSRHPNEDTAPSRGDSFDRVLRTDVGRINLSVLDDEAFEPESYLKSKLSNSTEAEVKSLQTYLENAKNESSGELQQSVVKNYSEFFVLSKEISTLENDLLELKQALSEWKAMPSLLHDDEVRHHNRQTINRSSVADLQMLYANQIEDLHNRIEGSYKFVQKAPGRHVVSETAEITSLNPASYKPEQTVHFILLDDALLVARKRKVRSGSGKDEALAAIRCWNLSDIVVLDIKDTPDLNNVLKIKDSKGVHVFRTERSADKRGLLNSFREVAADFAARKIKQREQEHNRRKSLWVGNESANRGVVPAVPAIPDYLQQFATQNEASDVKDSDQVFVNDFCDNLSVAIALRDWDEAVSLVEIGEERTPTSTILITKLAALKTTLVHALLDTLRDPSHRKAAVVHFASLLTRLGSAIPARNVFLETRADLLRKRMRLISFEGDTAVYISDLSIVVFTSVKHSADWYFGSFRDHESASTFVQWAKEQVQIYIDMFKIQVFQSDVDATGVEKCQQIALQQSKRLLGENGLDFTFLLDQILSVPQNNRPPYKNRHSAARLSLDQAALANLMEQTNGQKNRTPISRNVPLPPRSVNRPASVVDNSNSNGRSAQPARLLSERTIEPIGESS